LIPYKTNNIEFRIASADAIGKFKTTQAHSFLQVCRREFDFDICSREVVLLSYERFSQWLMDTEKEFLIEERKMPSSDLIETVVSSFVEVLEGIEKVTEENPKIFPLQLVKYLKMIHAYSTKIMKVALPTAMKKTSAKSFGQVTLLASEYLQHLLIAMHEYNNNLLLKREPFICVSDFSKISYSTFPFISLRTRAEFFREQEGLKTFVLKNYSSDDMLAAEVATTLAGLGIGTRNEVHEMSM
jgi:hypothetical protein